MSRLSHPCPSPLVLGRKVHAPYGSDLSGRCEISLNCPAPKQEDTSIFDISELEQEFYEIYQKASR